MIVEINMAEEPSSQPSSWEDTELGPREASEYRAAAARLNYLVLDRPDIIFASKECSRRMPAPRNGEWTRPEAGGEVLARQAKVGLEIHMAGQSKVRQRL